MPSIIGVRKADGTLARRKSWRYDKLPPEDAELFWIWQPENYDPGKEYRFTDGKLVVSTEVTAQALLTIRHSELVASDWTAIADREPMPEWVAYRTALRDLTQDGKDVDKMIARFPLRPDGTDPIANMRGTV